MNLENEGFVTLNGSAAHLSHKTVIVLGTPRGGTSMVAGTLANLGVYMGEQLSVVFQDQVLSQCIKEKDKKKAKQAIRARNEQYPLWGTKNDFPRTGTWLRLFREPVYVVVFRDIFATANRRVVSENLSLLSEMFSVLSFYLLILVFLRFSKRPILLVSYEKALLAPEKFVNELSNFLGIDNRSTFAQAVRFISPSPAEYKRAVTDSAQLDAEGQFFGYLDRIYATQIGGWALSISDTEPLEVRLFVNGVSQQTTFANLPRSDVAQADTRFREQCGFRFELPPDRSLKRGDRVEVCLSVQKHHLIHSPQRFV